MRVYADAGESIWVGSCSEAGEPAIARTIAATGEHRGSQPARDQRVDHDADAGTTVRVTATVDKTINRRNSDIH